MVSEVQAQLDYPTSANAEQSQTRIRWEALRLVQEDAQKKGHHGMSEITYMLIPADMKQSTKIGQCKFADTYQLMQSTVGGYIELVSLKLADMFINEEGKLQGLQPNPRATQLAWTDHAIGYDDMIVGNAIIFGKPNEVGEESSITPEFRSHTLRVLGGQA